MIAGSYKTIDSVKTWFFENDLPYYTLYQGTTTAGLTIHNQSKYSDVQRAWDILERNLREMSEGSGGVFLVVTRRAKDNGEANMKDTAAPRALVSLGPNPDLNLNPYTTMQTQTPQVRGIAGIESAQDLEALISGRVSEALSAQKKEIEAQKKIEDLEAAIEGLQEVNPTVKHLTATLAPALSQLAQIGTLLIAQKMGLSLPAEAIAGMTQPPPPQSGEADTDDELELDYDLLEDSVTILKKQGVQNPEALLKKAAQYAANNPQMIQVLENL